MTSYIWIMEGDIAWRGGGGFQSNMRSYKLRNGLKLGCDNWKELYSTPFHATEKFPYLDFVEIY
jgi:hypothetical protein